MIKKLFLKLIKIYQIFISPNLGFNCRFYPSCSEYTVSAIEKYGIFQGIAKGIWRILRCNSLNKGGVDLP
ncbi:MAG: membrane protein insertion efficiency factor YidD [Candidatus Nealsonbacteria bacterium RBG_13_42_11]|uniref:Putative membrane protein insertion efficiency factor n=1 Tax=Candidatus Nealsonbacteria bacterium RBG_13_42_11 TaxID=1801663 RepID=A0A1G2E1B1_9BACT|nr:MAG: membrane protein insertion efficiency factor YidD [Candidatus Nealsonbacteria bacterium RBG_13_42_11]